MKIKRQENAPPAENSSTHIDPGNDSAKTTAESKPIGRKNTLKLQLEEIRTGWDAEKAEREVAINATTLPKSWKQVKYRIMSGGRKRCSVCNSSDRVTVHHRDSNERNGKEGNLVPLCFECHDKLPVSPFSDFFFCKTMILGNGVSLCLRLGATDGMGLEKNNCTFFSNKHGCLMAALEIIKTDRRFKPDTRTLSVAPRRKIQTQTKCDIKP